VDTFAGPCIPMSPTHNSNRFCLLRDVQEKDYENMI
jgi:hypothetical protein